MGQACSNTGDDSDDKKKKEEEERAEEERKKKEEEERKRREGEKVELVINRPAGTHRDRVMALFAKYEVEKLVYLDPWLEKLPNPRRREGFIRDYVLKHGPEPPSKMHAVREAISKHPEFGGDKHKMQAALDKFRHCEAGQEIPVFADIFGLELPKKGEELPEDFGTLENIQSMAFDPVGGVVDDEDQEPLVSTCSEDLKDRIIAMLVEYDVERLATIRDTRDYPDSDKGAEFLFDLIETFGEEPESKQAAVTDLLREVFEEHDPHRMRSLPTIVAMAMSPGGISVLIKILRQYGIVKQSLTQQELIEAGIISAPVTVSNIAGGTNEKKRKTPGLAGGAVAGQHRSRAFKAAPLDTSEGPLVSNYDRANAFLDASTNQHSFAAVAEKVRLMRAGASAFAAVRGNLSGSAAAGDECGIDQLLDDDIRARGAIEDDLVAPNARVTVKDNALSSSDDDDDSSDDGRENAFLPGEKSSAKRCKSRILPTDDLLPAAPSTSDFL